MEGIKNRVIIVTMGNLVEKFAIMLNDLRVEEEDDLAVEDSHYKKEKSLLSHGKLEKGFVFLFM